jgi:hypothetical protein
MIEHKSNCSDLALAYKIDEGVHQSLSEFENMSYPDVTRRVTQQCSEMMPDFSRLLKISPDKPNAVVWNPVSVTSVDGNQEAVAYLQNMDVVSSSSLTSTVSEAAGSLCEKPHLGEPTGLSR